MASVLTSRLGVTLAWLWVAAVLAAYLYQFRDIIRLVLARLGG